MKSGGFNLINIFLFLNSWNLKIMLSLIIQNFAKYLNLFFLKIDFLLNILFLK